MAASVVVVRRIDLQRRIEREQLAEQAVVERVRIAARQVGAPGAADQQGVAGEDAVLGDEAHRVAGVPRRVQHAQAQLADDEHLAVIDLHIDPRGRGGAVHHRRRLEAARQLARGREMIGVGVRVDDEAHAQTLARGEGQVAIDLADLGIDQRGGAGVAAAHQVGLAAAGRDLLEDHRGGRAFRPSAA